MQVNFFQIKKMSHDTYSNLNKFVDNHVNKLLQENKIVAVYVEEYQSPRSLSANNLYWLWLSEIAKYLTKKNHKADKDDLHDLMKHKFLGYTAPRKVGKTEIQSTLKSTKKLKKNEFCFYMEQVEAWSAEIGCYLSNPADSEYMRYKEAQIK